MPASRLRLCFASPSHEQIREGVAVLADVCRTGVRRAGPNRQCGGARPKLIRAIRRPHHQTDFSMAGPFPASLGHCPRRRRRHGLEHGAVLHAAACPINSWTILFWRGLFGGGADHRRFMVLTQGRAGLRDLTGMGRKRLAGRVAVDLGHGRASSRRCSSPASPMWRSSSRRDRSSPPRSPGSGLAKFPAGEPFWRASWRSAAS